MPIDLYYSLASPPCRAVMMLARAIGVHLNLKAVNVFEGEHLKPEFTKINPQHTIPTIDDNGFILWESRSIMAYLVDKYAKDDSLYPKDPRKKGVLDQRLYFDIGSFYQTFLKCYSPVLFGHAKAVEEEDLKALEKSFEFLDTFLEGQRFVAGECLTIADFSIIVTVTTVEVFGFDVGRYYSVATWYQRCKDIMKKFGYEEVNVAGAKLLGDKYKRRSQ